MAIDKRGARWSLVVAMVGAGAGYALLALSARASHAVAAIIAARAVIGIFKQTQTIAKAAVAAVTPFNVRRQLQGALQGALQGPRRVVWMEPRRTGVPSKGPA